MNHQALAVDRNRARVRVLDRTSGKETDLPYDRLIIATGARSRKLGLPGEDRDNIFMLKGMADGIRMRRFIDERRPRKAVIVGAGYISLEVAEALRERKVETTLLYRGEAPYSGLEPELGPLIVDELQAHGVAFKGGVLPRAFETEGRRAVKIATNQGDFAADLFFVGVGVEPHIELAREAGLAIGPAGGIQVNDRMQTGDPLIYAAGDCCEKFHRVTGRPVISPLGDTANKEGRVAGENAAGGDSRFYGIVGAASSKVFNVEIGMAGITEDAAKRLGFTAVSQVVEAKSRVGIYPGAQYSLLKIVADQATGRLLGGNWIGRDGEARKINTLAVALHNNMTLEEISRLDLAYAPPFSPVWDPLLIAAGLLKRKVKN
ncbi:MAG: FAD-dependent oxidoreductase [Deltaproteobacteria bacterium]|nr:FAD-dependent oxidoreductase [Deltaproteobacteria bacterium]